MGDIYNVTCKSKECRYHATLRKGVGMWGFAQLRNYEKALLSGEITNEDVLFRVNKGGKIKSGGIYLCPTCREFMSDNTFYLIENLSYSPYGTPRFDVTFPFGNPVCKKCESQLEYIPKILSSKVKCPQCGGELKGKLAGCFD